MSCESSIFYRVTVSAAGASYDLSPDLSSFTIEEDHRQPDRLVIEVQDPYKVFSHALREGMEVEVELGTTEDHGIVFRGCLYTVQAQFPEDGVPSLRVSAHDRSMSMGLRRRHRVWRDRSLSEIVEAVASEYFDEIEIEVGGDPRFEGNGLRQLQETDLAFLLRLATEYACGMYVEPTDGGEVFRFLSEHSLMSAEPSVTLYHGRSGVDLLVNGFNARVELADIELPRRYTGIDGQTGAELEAVETATEEEPESEDSFFDDNLARFAESGNEDRAAGLEGLIGASEALTAQIREELGGVRDEPQPAFTSPEHVQALANNRLSTGQLGMRGSGTTQGNRDIHANRMVRLGDLGGRFSGDWYVIQARHRVNDQGHVTEFSCRR
jgi:phage protein D